MIPIYNTVTLETNKKNNNSSYSSNCHKTTRCSGRLSTEKLILVTTLEELEDTKGGNQNP